MKKFSISEEPTTAEIARILEAAKKEFELKALICGGQKTGEAYFWRWLQYSSG